MKKKLLFGGVAMLFAAAAVTGFAVYEQSDVSDLLNANVEALARSEIETGDCYTDGTPPYGAYGGYHTCNNCRADADLTYGWLGFPCNS